MSTQNLRSPSPNSPHVLLLLWLQVSVATYGGGLWHTWFDRDLTLAGRVMLRADGKLQTRLVHIERPILKVPNLAIHLQTADERTAFKISKEDHICPILCTKIAAELAGEEGVDKPRHHAALLALLAEQLQCNPEDITDFELSVCDTQPASVGGLHNEFVFAPRIDNLASCFCALEAMATAEGLESDPQCRVIALFDHEEVCHSYPLWCTLQACGVPCASPCLPTKCPVRTSVCPCRPYAPVKPLRPPFVPCACVGVASACLLQACGLPLQSSGMSCACPSPLCMSLASPSSHWHASRMPMGCLLGYRTDAPHETMSHIRAPPALHVTHCDPLHPSTGGQRFLRGRRVHPHHQPHHTPDV